MKRVLAVAGPKAGSERAAPYEEALRAAGIELVIVAPGERASLGEFAGLVLMGGDDVNPARYGAVRHPATETTDDARDARESALIDEALDRDVPLLGICRGLQILNVCHGGTLLQDIEAHRVITNDKGLPAHEVTVEPGTRLAQIGGSRWKVNSRHHQAADRVGSGLIVTARDPRDGVIEAVERLDKRFVVAVQWHPENQREQGRLFEAFAAALG